MKRATIIILAVIVAAVAVWCLWRMAADSGRGSFDLSRMEKADRAVMRAIKDGQTPGAVLCVVKRADDG